MTYSLVAFDRKTGRLGSAVASHSVAVGGSVVYSRRGVGLVNTQHRAQLMLGERVLDVMESGSGPSDALRRVLSGDRKPDSRQFLAVNMEGRMGVWTGSGCRPAHAQMVGDSCAAAGNLLETPGVVEVMYKTFEETDGLEFGLRLLLCLEAGEDLGGDRRGTRAAAVKVVPPPDSQTAVNLDLRVDHHKEPLVELRRIHERFREEFPK